MMMLGSENSNERCGRRSEGLRMWNGGGGDDGGRERDGVVRRSGCGKDSLGWAEGLQVG